MDAHRVAPVGLNLPDGLGELLHAARAERDREPARRKLDRGGFADSRRCTSDDRGPAFGEGFEARHYPTSMVMGRLANPRTLLEWTRTALASSTSNPRIRLNSSASATRASILARWAPRQKWAPLPKLKRVEPISRPMT